MRKDRPRAGLAVGRAGTSMGPQLDSCGRHLLHVGPPMAPGTSMGPQLDSCGRLPIFHHGLPHFLLQWGRNLTVAEGSAFLFPLGVGVELQWGRNLTVAEGSIGALRPPALRRTSMGPQLDSCGRSRYLVQGRRSPQTSMGPQLDSCGRSLTAACVAALAGLQWGRNLTVAEGSICSDCGEAANVLQWGRNLTVAEGCYRQRHSRICLGTSMGPQLDSCGRLVPGPSQLQSTTLQWGRNLTVAEGPRPAPLPAERQRTSMGPQLDSCGRMRPRSCACRHVATSMGPQLDSCGRRVITPPCA